MGQCHSLEEASDGGSVLGDFLGLEHTTHPRRSTGSPVRHSKRPINRNRGRRRKSRKQRKGPATMVSQNQYHERQQLGEDALVDVNNGSAEQKSRFGRSGRGLVVTTTNKTSSAQGSDRARAVISPFSEQTAYTQPETPREEDEEDDDGSPREGPRESSTRQSGRRKDRRSTTVPPTSPEETNNKNLEMPPSMLSELSLAMKASSVKEEAVEDQERDHRDDNEEVLEDDEDQVHLLPKLQILGMAFGAYSENEGSEEEEDDDDDDIELNDDDNSGIIIEEVDPDAPSDEEESIQRRDKARAKAAKAEATAQRHAAATASASARQDFKAWEMEPGPILIPSRSRARIAQQGVRIPSRRETHGSSLSPPRPQSSVKLRHAPITRPNSIVYHEPPLTAPTSSPEDVGSGHTAAELSQHNNRGRDAPDSVDPHTLAHFNKLKVQVKLAKQEEKRKRRTKKLEDRYEDVRSYKALVKEFEEIQQQVATNNSSSGNSNSNGGKPLKRSRSFDLKNSSGWYFDFQSIDDTDDDYTLGSQQSKQSHNPHPGGGGGGDDAVSVSSNLSLLSAASMDKQRKYYEMKQARRRSFQGNDRPNNSIVVLPGYQPPKYLQGEEPQTTSSSSQRKTAASAVLSGSAKPRLSSRRAVGAEIPPAGAHSSATRTTVAPAAKLMRRYSRRKTKAGNPVSTSSSSVGSNGSSKSGSRLSRTRNGLKQIWSNSSSLFSYRNGRTVVATSQDAATAASGRSNPHIETTAHQLETTSHQARHETAPVATEAPPPIKSVTTTTKKVYSSHISDKNNTQVQDDNEDIFLVFRKTPHPSSAGVADATDAAATESAKVKKTYSEDISELEGSTFAGSHAPADELDNDYHVQRRRRQPLTPNEQEEQDMYSIDDESTIDTMDDPILTQSYLVSTYRATSLSRVSSSASSRHRKASRSGLTTTPSTLSAIPPTPTATVSTTTKTTSLMISQTSTVSTGRLSPVPPSPNVSLDYDEIDEKLLDNGQKGTTTKNCVPIEENVDTPKESEVISSDGLNVSQQSKGMQETVEQQKDRKDTKTQATTPAPTNGKYEQGFEVSETTRSITPATIVSDKTSKMIETTKEALEKSTEESLFETTKASANEVTLSEIASSLGATSSQDLLKEKTERRGDEDDESIFSEVRRLDFDAATEKDIAPTEHTLLSKPSDDDESRGAQDAPASTSTVLPDQTSSLPDDIAKDINELLSRFKSQSGLEVASSFRETATNA